MRRRQQASEVHSVLFQFGPGSPTLAAKLALIQSERARDPEQGPSIDHFLLAETQARHEAFVQLAQAHEALKGMADKLTSPPWHEAVYLGPGPPPGRRAFVSHGGSKRVVVLADEVDAASLAPGDAVLLSDGLNVVLGRSDAPACGETAAFARHATGGRLVIKSREEEVIVDAAGPLRDQGLRPGDIVRWNRAAWLALEKVPPADESLVLLEDTPRETFADIGGLDAKIEDLRETIAFRLDHPRIAAKYRRRVAGGILLIGPPGGGKTLLARALANWLASRSKSGRAFFLAVKPAAWLSHWYGVAEQNCRDAFLAARTAGDRDPDSPVVMFIDEVDSIASTQGFASSRADDRLISVLAAELDGFQSRGNLIVVAATNDEQAIAPKLNRPGRLRDKVVTVPRPDRKAAAAILGKHFPEDIPYDSGCGPDARAELIQSVVSRLYSPNGEGTIATVVLRDGKRIAVQPADLLSGSHLSRIAQHSIDLAARREARTGEEGVRFADAWSALAEVLEDSARSLGPSNCRRYLQGLPGGVDVVDVVPASRKTSRAYRVVSLEGA